MRALFLSGGSVRRSLRRSVRGPRPGPTDTPLPLPPSLLLFTRPRPTGRRFIRPSRFPRAEPEIPTRSARQARVALVGVVSASRNVNPPSIAPLYAQLYPPLKAPEYAVIRRQVLLRISRSGYVGRRKCLRPNPRPPKSEDLVLRIYTYDMYRRTDVGKPLKKRFSVKKRPAILLTNIKTKNHDARFAGRPEGMHPGVGRPLRSLSGAIRQPAGTLQGVLPGTPPASRGGDVEEAEDDAQGSDSPLPAPEEASASLFRVFRSVRKRQEAHPPAFRRPSPASAVSQARRRTFFREPRPRRSTAEGGTHRHARDSAFGRRPPPTRPSPSPHINTSATSMRHFGRINGKGPAKRTLRTPYKTSGRRP